MSNLPQIENDKNVYIAPLMHPNIIVSPFIANIPQN